MNEKFSKLGFYPSDILLPKKDVDMSKWAVVACDQFTSEPEYWERVEKTVGDAPSTLRLILPEANLKAPNVDEFIADINASMSKYLEEGIFETLKDSLIYIERGQSDGKIRHGLIGMVDLDQYDFTPGSGALIRATEGTVLTVPFRTIPSFRSFISSTSVRRIGFGISSRGSRAGFSSSFTISRNVISPISSSSASFL